jgi:hypothetical protein
LGGWSQWRNRLLETVTISGSRFLLALKTHKGEG